MPLQRRARRGHLPAARGARQRSRRDRFTVRGRRCDRAGVVFLVLVGVTFANTGCLSPDRARLRAWTTLEEEATAAYPQAAEPRTAPVRLSRAALSAAINETVALRVSVVVDEGTLIEPAFVIPTLRSSESAIGPEAVEVFRLHPVQVGPPPGWVIRQVPPARRVRVADDVLVPLRASRGGMPAELLVGTEYTFWVDITVVKGTPPGTYQGSLVLNTSGRAAVELPLKLVVRPFVLPDRPRRPFIVSIDHRALIAHHLRQRSTPPAIIQDDGTNDPRPAAITGLLRGTLREIERHGLTPVLPDLTPPMQLTAQGELRVDADAYEGIVLPFVGGAAFADRRPLDVWLAPLAPVQLKDPSSGRSTAGNLGEPWDAQYVDAVASLLRSSAWRAAVIAGPPCAGAPSESRAATTHRYAELLRARIPELPIASHLFPQDMRPWGWVGFPRMDLRDQVDIWIPPAQFYDPEIMSEQRSAGRRTWVAADRPPFSGTASLHAAPADQLVFPWMLERLGAEALWFGTVNRWPADPAGNAPHQCAAYDNHVLLYPGAYYGLAEPIASVRLKRLRRAAQDAAYIDLLHAAQLGHLADALTRALVPYAGSQAYRTHFADGRIPSWPEDESLFATARHVMAGALQQEHDAPGASRPLDEGPQNVAWRRLMLATGRLHATVEGVTVGTTAEPGADRLRIDVALNLGNHRRFPLAGSVSLGPVPESWSVSEHAAAFAAIPPNRARRVVVTAGADHLEMDAAGTIELPVAVTTDDQRTTDITARLAFVRAVPAEQPLAIDGDLSDWPLGVANVMADFVLTSGAATGTGRVGRARPTQPTTAFVLRDETSLYVAVQCAQRHARSQSAYRKGVVHDDLVPVGEEVVEVLIDPSGMRTRSPADLFYMAIKPNGSDVTTRGVRFDPPCGEWSPWAVELSLATRTTLGQWTIEMRIPFAAFGSEATPQGVWGLNITRFDAAGEEFSAWSAVSGSAYDPLALGNLYLGTLDRASPAGPVAPR